MLAALLLVALVLVRRRRVLRPAPELADVPVDIRGLVKEYAGGYRAVDDVSFRVERGQVVGLLGPNGAGKTTALRVLVGLITPTAGELHVFGEPVAPGAPVLARLGAFIEGPGFLPHLTGRENLRLYWAATGRPDDEAEFATALDIAGLGASIDRKVRTYSQGMQQRLGIAQAMLGLPELLVLDEPTNGLDPPQIAEMREVMKRYAETGRTVVVSSHLLAEVEQTCTHVVVMHKGRLVSAGSVAELAASDETQLSVADPAAAAKVLAARRDPRRPGAGPPAAGGGLPRADRRVARRRVRPGGGLMGERELSRSAATVRGVHDRLAGYDPGRRPSYRPGRTLRFRVEFVRQVKRRRTQVTFGLLVLLPILIAIAFKVGGGAGSRRAAAGRARHHRWLQLRAVHRVRLGRIPAGGRGRAVRR